MIIIDPELTLVIVLFAVIGFGTGIIVSFAQRCAYCGNMIFGFKAKTRYPIEFGYIYIPYHRKCYVKYAKVKENQIVS
jgi:hypothetical protein